MATAQSKVQRFNEYGYRTIHLFGPWYLVRNYGRSHKFSLYGLMRITDDIIIHSDIPSCPEGKFRIGKEFVEN